MRQDSNDGTVTQDEQQGVTRRHALQALAATATSAAFGSALPAFGQPNTLVSTVFGGRYEAQYKKWLVEPFSKATGAKISLKLGAPSEWLTSALVNKQRPEIDILLLNYPESVRAVATDVTAKLTVKDIPNLRDVDPIWLDQYQHAGVGFDYATFGIGYRTDLVPNPPKSWADLWKPEYAGKIALPAITVGGVWQLLVMAAKINGGNESNIAPAFKALSSLKGNVKRFYRSSPEAVQLLTSGEVAIVAMIPDLFIYGIQDAGRPVRFVLPSEGAGAGMASLHIAKNTPNMRLAQQFVNFALSKEVQEGFCNAISAGPSVKGIQLSGKAKDRVPSIDKLFIFDWMKVVPQMPALADRWNQEIAS